MSVPSGLPRDHAFPTIRVGEIDVEGQVAEFADALRSLRHGIIGSVAVLGVLAIALAVVGAGDAAIGVFLMMVFPLAVVLVIIEIVGLARRRRSRRPSSAE